MPQQPLEQTRNLPQFKSLAELDAKPRFKMVEHRLLVENESVQVASKANDMSHLNGKDVTSRDIPGQCLATLEGKRRHSIWPSAVVPIEADRIENGVKTCGVK